MVWNIPLITQLLYMRQELFEENQESAKPKPMWTLSDKEMIDGD